MASHGLTDLVATLTISKNEYERLVRDSEQLSIITKYVTNSSCVTSSDIKVLLDLKEDVTKELNSEPKECETDGI